MIHNFKPLGLGSRSQFYMKAQCTGCMHELVGWGFWLGKHGQHMCHFLCLLKSIKNWKEDEQRYKDELKYYE